MGLPAVDQEAVDQDHEADAAMLSTSTRLTRNGVAKLLQLEPETGMELQVLGTFRYHPASDFGNLTGLDTRTAQLGMFDIVLSDGEFKVKCLLHPTFCSAVFDGTLSERCTVRIQRAEVHKDDTEEEDCGQVLNVTILQLSITGYEPHVLLPSPTYDDDDINNNDNNISNGSTSSPPNPSPSFTSMLQCATQSHGHSIAMQLAQEGAFLKWHPRCPPRSRLSMPLIVGRDLYVPVTNRTNFQFLEAITDEQPIVHQTPCLRRLFDEDTRWGCVDANMPETRMLEYLSLPPVHLMPSTISSCLKLNFESRKHPRDVVGVVIKKSCILYSGHVPDSQNKNKLRVRCELVIADAKGEVDVVLWDGKCMRYFDAISVGDIIMLSRYDTRKYQGITELRLNSKHVVPVSDTHPQSPDTGGRLYWMTKEQCARLDIRATNLATVKHENTGIIDVLRHTMSEPDVPTCVRGQILYLGPRLCTRTSAEDLSEFRWLLIGDESTKLLLALQVFANSNPVIFHSLALWDIVHVCHVQSKVSAASSVSLPSMWAQTTIHSIIHKMSYERFLDVTAPSPFTTSNTSTTPGSPSGSSSPFHPDGANGTQASCSNSQHANSNSNNEPTSKRRKEQNNDNNSSNNNNNSNNNQDPYDTDIFPISLMEWCCTRPTRSAVAVGPNNIIPNLAMVQISSDSSMLRPTSAWTASLSQWDKPLVPFTSVFDMVHGNEQPLVMLESRLVRAQAIVTDIQFETYARQIFDAPTHKRANSDLSAHVEVQEPRFIFTLKDVNNKVTLKATHTRDPIRAISMLLPGSLIGLIEQLPLSGALMDRLRGCGSDGERLKLLETFILRKRFVFCFEILRSDGGEHGVHLFVRAMLQRKGEPMLISVDNVEGEEVE